MSKTTHAATYLPDTTYYNRTGAAEFMARLEREPLLMQGPMGSVLVASADAREVPAAFWNLAEPQAVVRIHRLYEAAGAQILLTNTFQASQPALERDEIMPPMAEVNRAAVDNARAAHPQVLVGSMGPCGIDWTLPDSPEFRAARDAYRAQAHALLAAGVDALLLETFTSIRDFEPAIKGACDAADGMPVLASFAIDEDANLLGDGLTIEGALLYAEKHGAQAVGVNCCSLEAAAVAVPRMVRAARTPVMVRPNAGAPVKAEDGSLVWHECPERFEDACATWLRAGARIVGGCCGTTARTTSALADALVAYTSYG